MIGRAESREEPIVCSKIVEAKNGIDDGGNGIAIVLEIFADTEVVNFGEMAS